MKTLFDSLKAALRSSSRKSCLGQTRKGLRRSFQLEALEDRRVFDAAFGSVMGIGNGESNLVAYDVATDATGNRYVAGYFSGTQDFDPAAVHAGDVDILMARGMSDAYVAKYSPDDALLWVRRMGGDTERIVNTFVVDRATQLEVDANSNVYVVGTFEGNSDFGSTTLSTTGDMDGFIAKLSGDGAFLWAKQWGDTSDDLVNGVDVDGSGNVYVSAAPARTNLAVIKLSSSGNTIWDQRIATGMGQSHVSAALTVDSSGNVFVSGTFVGSVDFDPGVKTKLVSTGGASASAFTLKLTTQGKLGWVSAFQGGSISVCSGGISLDGSGNLIVSGGYLGSVDFNPSSGVANIGARGGFIAKLNSSGGYVWAKSLDTNTNQTAPIRELAIDTAGAIYIVGQYDGTVDLDPGAGTVMQTTNGGRDVFLLKLTSAGGYQWSETFGGVGDDFARMALDGQNNIHLAGYFQYSVDFDAGAGDATLSTTGTTYKGFLKKLRQV